MLSIFRIVIVDQTLLYYSQDKKTFSIVHMTSELIFVLATVVLLFVMIYRQIAAERRSRQVWQEREEHLRFLINTMPDFVCYKDAKGRWVEANAFALELFQLQEVAYKGKTDKDLAEEAGFYRDALFYCYESDQEALQCEDPVRLEEVIPLPNGKRLTFDVIKVPTTHPDGLRKGLVVIGRNITERKEAEERYKSLFEQNPDPIASFDVYGNLMTANAACEKVTGYTLEELQTMDFSQLVFEEDIEKVRKNFRAALAGDHPSFEIPFRHKDGHRIDMSVKNVPIVVHGEIVGVYGIARDIRDWKRAEEMLRKSDRLSIVGQLAAGVAHEIRNPLATLSGFVQLLNEQSSENKHYYDIMLSELDRINFIVSEFMMLAKPQVLEFEQKDLKKILHHVITLANTQAIMNKIDITATWPKNLPLITCGENQLKQVFINILKNAMEAMPWGGELAIQVHRPNPDYVVIQFKDQGIGIPEDRIERLGEPFYSTKEKGTGLGLMVSYKIIEAHGGRLLIESEVGKGTTVDVVLPVGGG
ncbi:PAS domain S-box protein [Ammoniphilus sp. 3BR4]|uniref:PAS domain-containing sensor histidine kinase n=1 Tax=Ammoniphilus sp. 3BR4 TaxID=3158265 RepID=UPI003465D828